jgi:3-oxoacyl-[acyl-carrier-protein] synthase-3
MPYAHITGWGMSIPQKVLTNDDISKMVETNDQWIQEMTGIRERHIAGESDTSASLGADACFKALKMAGLTPDDVDLIICSTSSPEHIFPATACIIQDQLGASKAGAFDLSAACSGFIYALQTGSQSIKVGDSKVVLVIGAETLSRFVDWTDRNTCILFGDGAGAFVLQASEQPGGIQKGVIHSDGSGGDYLTIPAGGSAHPTSEATLHSGKHFIHMNGKEVFRFATRVLVQSTHEVLAKTGWKVEELKMIIPHQANKRIIDAAARGLNLPIEQFYINLDKYGNTSTASIPIAAVEAAKNKKINPGDKLVFVGFGAGLTWGALAVEWSGPINKPFEKHYITADWYKPWAMIRRFFKRILRMIDSFLFDR